MSYDRMNQELAALEWMLLDEWFQFDGSVFELYQSQS